ncbi:MAG: DUF2752 domain-containing protein [Oscillospiraceae bacterium]|nr:DUF2752 domain-containing protein [Oscillospiraceae bacterium]
MFSGAFYNTIMFAFFKKFSPKTVLVVCDLLLIPALIACERLSDRMLAKNATCPWNFFGGKCITCGGTHFVNSVLNFKFAEAFGHNQYLFVLAVFFALSFLLLNLHKLFGIQFAKRVLRKMYNIPMLIAGCVLMVLFVILRNLPLFF